MAQTNIVAEPGMSQVIVTRVFDAPRERVYAACTDPAQIPHWWGPRELVTTVEKMEVRPGGEWRFIQRDPQGNEYAFHGVYHEVIPNERTVNTFEFEGMPGHAMMEVTVFEEEGDKTKVTTTSVFQSVADRDGMVQSGMERGQVDSTDRLAELLAKG